MSYRVRILLLEYLEEGPDGFNKGNGVRPL